MKDDGRTYYRYDHRLLFDLNMSYRMRVRMLSDFLESQYSAAYSALMRAFDKSENTYTWVREHLSDEDEKVLGKMISERIFRFTTSDKQQYWLMVPFEEDINEKGLVLLVRSAYRSVHAYRQFSQHMMSQILLNLEDFQANKRKEILARIRSIRGELKRTKVGTTERTNRCIKLVDELKDLYSDTCQLCNPISPIPKIIKDDGYYVEMHHIRPISIANHPTHDEESVGELDTDQNAVIVCPHHHKVLHYHEGGCDKLLYRDDETFYFETHKGTCYPVYVNHHFEIRP